MFALIWFSVRIFCNLKGVLSFFDRVIFWILLDVFIRVVFCAFGLNVSLSGLRYD